MGSEINVYIFKQNLVAVVGNRLHFHIEMLGIDHLHIA